MHHDLTSTRNYTYNRAVFLVRSERDGGSGESAVQFSRRLLIVKGAANAAPPYRDYQETAFGNQLFEKNDF